MATRRTTANDITGPARRRSRPATTPEAREQELIAMTYDLVEERIRNGTASSQETSHFLKMGSMREAVERQRIAGEVELNKAKIETMAQGNHIEALMNEALAAMRSYRGEAPPSDRGYDD